MTDKSPKTLGQLMPIEPKKWLSLAEIWYTCSLSEYLGALFSEPKNGWIWLNVMSK